MNEQPSQPQDPIYHRAQLVPSPLDAAEVRRTLKAAMRTLSDSPADASGSEIAGKLDSLVAARPNSTALRRALNIALTGETACDDLPGALDALGRAGTLRLLRRALDELTVVA
jgi:hypothetical protein